MNFTPKFSKVDLDRVENWEFKYKDKTYKLKVEDLLKLLEEK